MFTISIIQMADLADMADPSWVSLLLLILLLLVIGAKKVNMPGLLTGGFSVARESGGEGTCYVAVVVSVREQQEQNYTMRGTGCVLTNTPAQAVTSPTRAQFCTI